MIIAYKALNKDMTCTHGAGVYKYPVKKWVEEKEANVGNNGLHAALCPLDCLNYYDLGSSVIYLALCDGDTNEDGYGTRISCTRMKLIEALSLEQIIWHSINYICNHPFIKINSRYLQEERGIAADLFVIVQGEEPMAMAKEVGAYLGFVKKDKCSKAVYVQLFKCDGVTIMPNVFYDYEGKEVEAI